MATARAEVDTSRPFRSVKEAVSVFGERILAGDAFSLKGNLNSRHDMNPKPPNSAASSPPRSFSSPSSHFNHDREDEGVIISSLRKLEVELEETKRELILLKEREAETEVVVASLNAELHKNMSKIAAMEAVNAGNSVKSIDIQRKSRVGSDCWVEENEIQEKSEEIEVQKYEYLPTLAQILRLGEIEEDLWGKKKEATKVVKKKKKPIIPLISDIFPIKRASGDRDGHDSIYNSSLYS